MDLTAINSAMDAAFSVALANPVKQPATPVNGNADQTVAVVTYVAPTGSGFRVMGRIKVGNYSATKVLNHGPDTASERDWPAEGIEAAAAAFISRCIAAGEAHVERAGFTGSRLAACQDELLTAREAGTLAQRPKLLATYQWLQTVKQMAIAGSTAFPPTPHTFEEVVSE